jgi:hypothetical protein
VSRRRLAVNSGTRLIRGSPLCSENVSRLAGDDTSNMSVTGMPGRVPWPTALRGHVLPQRQRFFGCAIIRVHMMLPDNEVAISSRNRVETSGWWLASNRFGFAPSSLHEGHPSHCHLVAQPRGGKTVSGERLLPISVANRLRSSPEFPASLRIPVS